MISRLTTLLFMLGFLFLVTARPVTHQDAEEEGTIDDLPTDEELEDLFKSIVASSKAEKQQGFSFTLPWPTGKKQGIKVPMPSNSEQTTGQGTLQHNKNAKEQGISITLPDGSQSTFDWLLGTEQGRRVPFGDGKTKGTVQNTKNTREQGFTITLPDHTFEWSQKQGRRIPLPNEQVYTGYDFLNGLYQSSKSAKEQGRRIPFSKEQTYNGINLEDFIKYAKEQGITVTLPDGNTFDFGQEQGRRVGWAEEQGQRIGWGKEQGRRVGWGEEQGKNNIVWAEQQGRLVPFGKEQGRIVPYFGSDTIGLPKEQGIRTPFSKTQVYYRFPYSEEQGIRVIPSAKQQSIILPYYYRKQQDLSKELNELMKDEK